MEVSGIASLAGRHQVLSPRSPLGLGSLPGASSPLIRWWRSVRLAGMGRCAPGTRRRGCWWQSECSAAPSPWRPHRWRIGCPTHRPRRGRPHVHRATSRRTPGLRLTGATAALTRAAFRYPRSHMSSLPPLPPEREEPTLCTGPSSVRPAGGAAPAVLRPVTEDSPTHSIPARARRSLVLQRCLP